MLCALRVVGGIRRDSEKTCRTAIQIGAEADAEVIPSHRLNIARTFKILM